MGGCKSRSCTQSRTPIVSLPNKEAPGGTVLVVGYSRVTMFDNCPDICGNTDYLLSI